MSALSLAAADRLLDDLFDARIRAGIDGAFSNDAAAPASEAAPAGGSGAPGSQAGAAELSPREMAAMLRGEARADDGAAVALFARIGLSAERTLALLPMARAIAGARPNPGA